MFKHNIFFNNCKNKYNKYLLFGIIKKNILWFV